MIWKGECLRRNRYEIEKVGGVLGEVAFMKLALIPSKDKDSNGISQTKPEGNRRSDTVFGAGGDKNGGSPHTDPHGRGEG